MDSHIIKLDPPYNIIFDIDKRFALHIGTLIVVDEITEKKGRNATATLRTRSFPVVGHPFYLAGEVWSDIELKDVHHICRHGEHVVTIRELRRFMEYCSRKGWRHLEDGPMSFEVNMLLFDIKIDLKDQLTQQIISDYSVELVFDETEGPVNKYTDGRPAYIGDGICNVHSSVDSPFFFDTFIIPKNDDQQISRAIEALADLRGAYIHVLRFDGLKSITFTTRNLKYQEFVDKLNKTEGDPYGI